MLKAFKNNQRIVVTQVAHDLLGRAGVVKRIRRADDGAFVEMDSPIPESARLFPADDESGRGNHVLLYPGQCEDETIAALAD